MNFKLNTWMVASMLSLGGTAWAASDAASDHTQHHAGTDTAVTATAATALTAGEVRKVDGTQGKVTIRHEAITNLDMPAMTMVFSADKPDLLKGLKAGDRIRFRAESVAGAMVVTQIEPAK
jgi:Cu(I)/Ag(I) efflux system periplasmic protein CusF